MNAMIDSQPITHEKRMDRNPGTKSKETILLNGQYNCKRNIAMFINEINVIIAQ
jgi:hypothetical protein